VRVFRPLRSLLLIAAVVLSPVLAVAAVTKDEAAKSLPDQVDQFRANAPAQLPPADLVKIPTPEDYGITSYASRYYVVNNGQSVVNVTLIKTLSDSGAYALLTDRRLGGQEVKLGVIGTASVEHLGGLLDPAWVAFFKGRDFVIVGTQHKGQASPDEVRDFARGLAQTLDASEDDIPVLIRHLPQWQSTQPWAHYAVSLNSLEQHLPNQPILNEVNFEGGTEAVVAYYGPARLAVIEFTTPQLSVDNDRRIAAKIQELRNAGQPVPSAYRRVGNYSVFVFDAPDEKTAGQLIDQVKYEQVVQWLGENPYWFEKAQRMYAQTTAGVLLAVMQSSGLSLLTCLTIGGIFGFLLFRRRRTQQANEVYSDAGGMVRLNLDELTGESKGPKLLGRGKQ
jgi:hypothetical protein